MRRDCNPCSSSPPEVHLLSVKELRLETFVDSRCALEQSSCHILSLQSRLLKGAIQQDRTKHGQCGGGGGDGRLMQEVQEARRGGPQVCQMSCEARGCQQPRQRQTPRRLPQPLLSLGNLGPDC